MERLTDDKILIRLTNAARSSGVHMTFAVKSFYLKMLDFALEYGEPCPEGVKILLSVEDLSVRLSVPFRTVIKSLQVLSDCGVILRYYGRVPDVTRTKYTVIFKRIYERSISDD